MTTKKMNLPLPAKMHRELFAQARDEGVPATRLVRRVLRRWLDERAQAKEANELKRFAERYAGTDVDLLPDLGVRSLSFLSPPPVVKRSGDRAS